MPSLFSPYEQEIDISSKIGARLYKKGSEKLPTKFTAKLYLINDVGSCATECKWDSMILKFTINGVVLNLIKGYGRIPMSALLWQSGMHAMQSPLWM
jgi:hypothetical protein